MQIPVISPLAVYKSSFIFPRRYLPIYEDALHNDLSVYAAECPVQQLSSKFLSCYRHPHPSPNATPGIMTGNWLCLFLTGHTKRCWGKQFPSRHIIVQKSFPQVLHLLVVAAVRRGSWLFSFFWFVFPNKAKGRGNEQTYPVFLSDDYDAVIVQCWNVKFIWMMSRTIYPEKDRKRIETLSCLLYEIILLFQSGWAESGVGNVTKRMWFTFLCTGKQWILQHWLSKW